MTATIIDVKEILSRHQSLYLKSIVEILTDDYEEYILFIRVYANIRERKALQDLLRKDPQLSLTDESLTDEVTAFIKHIRKNFEIFYLRGRIKIARISEKPKSLYGKYQLAELEEYSMALGYGKSVY